MDAQIPLLSLPESEPCIHCHIGLSSRDELINMFCVVSRDGKHEVANHMRLMKLTFGEVESSAAIVNARQLIEREKEGVEIWEKLHQRQPSARIAGTPRR